VLIGAWVGARLLVAAPEGLVAVFAVVWCAVLWRSQENGARPASGRDLDRLSDLFSTSLTCAR